MLEALTAIVIFSFVPLAVKYTSANPFTIGLFRLVLTTAMIGFYYRKGINWKAYRAAGFWKLLVIGVCFFFHWLTYTFSVKLAGPSLCALGMSTYGVQLIFYGSFFLGYHVRLKNILCLILILGGVALVIPNWNINDNTTFGFILALLSASFYAVIPIMLQKSHEFAQETRIFLQFFVAMIGYLLLSGQAQWSNLNSYDWSALLFLAIIGTFIAHTLWSKATSRLPTTTTGVLYYLVTPGAMILSHYLLDEFLSVKQQIGGAVILGAALLNTINQSHFKSLISFFNKDKLCRLRW